jgi:chorismate-pyruvate lyase
MTKTLKSLDNNLSVEILKTGVQGDNYVRIIALKLSNTPVIAAISQTNLQNKLFKDIIANADTTPIGTKLFTPNSSIKRRDDMLIRKIKLSSIKNPVVTAYLSKLGYTDNDLIIERYSIFYYQQQTLDLIEYILPSIDKFVNH